MSKPIVNMTNEELESFLITMDYKGKPLKAECLMELLARANKRTVAERNAERMQRVLEAMDDEHDLFCLECGWSGNHESAKVRLTAPAEVATGADEYVFCPMCCDIELTETYDMPSILIAHIKEGE